MPLLTKNQRLHNGTHLVTTNLFWEIMKNKDKAVFSIAETPSGYGATLIPFRDLYLKYTVDDPTEYTFAIEVFGSWYQWERICSNKKMADYLAKIRRERDVLIESNSIKEVFKQANDGNYQAAKFLVTKGYDVKEAEKIAPSRRKKTKTVTTEDEDLERILNSE